MKIFLINNAISNIVYNFFNKIFKLTGYLSESIHRKGLKQFFYNIVPSNLQESLLKKHINKLSNFPTIFSIEITNVCNAKCWFCPTHYSKRQKGYMNFSLFKKIIDEIKPMSEIVKSVALFMDGESALHKELIDFLKYSAGAGIKKMYISSNMEYFTPELIDKIFEANLGNALEYIMCSLDGTSDEIYSKNRIGCDFKKAIYNTEYLIEQRNLKRKLYPRIFTRLLVSELTKNEVDKFREFWKGKSDKVLCYNMHNWGGELSDEKLNIDYNNNKFVPCYFTFSQFAIQYDGSVRLCCVDANGTTIIGDVNRQSIKEIWNGQVINRIRKNHLEANALPGICKNCSYPKKGSWAAPYYWYK